MSEVAEYLKPIPGENPSGENMYYSPLMKEVEEAAREEEELGQGVWKREIKKADYKTVVKLTSKALKEKTKDLFLAAYLCEAWARMDGLEGVLRGLELIRGLLDGFWETIYPEIEDGDAEFRGTALARIAHAWAPAIYSIPLTATGVDWYAYKASLDVPPEAEATKEPKKGIRKQAIEDGKLTPEEFDEALKATPVEHLEAVIEEGEASIAALDELDSLCMERFDEEARPNLAPARLALEEVVNSAKILLDRKKPAAAPAAPAGPPPAAEPAKAAAADPFGESPKAKKSASPFADDPPPAPPAEAPAAEPEAPKAAAADPFGESPKAKKAASPFADDAPPAAPAPAPEPPKPEAPKPAAADPFAAPAKAAPPAPVAAPAPAAFAMPKGANPAEAIAAGALAMRRVDPKNPAPYLTLRGLRWGELRAGGSEIDDLLLEAPRRETRVELKLLEREGKWEELLEAAETAMAAPCGRGWLDIQRYVAQACAELGKDYAPVSDAVRTQLWLLLHDFPDLPRRTLDDDTPAANPATLEWLRGAGKGALPEPPQRSERPGDEEEFEPEPPDAWDEAQRELDRGRPDEALAILRRQLGRESSERGRFERNVQMARVCLASGGEAVALPILEELAKQIERHALDQWEEAETVSEPLELLHRCLSRLKPGDGRLSAIHDRLCRLDPLRALRLSR